VIIGGGFAGLAAAKALRRAPVRVTLVDRRNHHVFQPLLYQVATAALSPAQIAAPIRRILSSQANAEVLLAEVLGIDPAAGTLTLDRGSLRFDALVLAPGATHSYFGHDGWAAHAPGLKTIDDAIDIRRRFLLAFERAEREPDPAARAALLTFAVIGAGPTGVELAGSMIEIARHSIPSDFRSINTADARVLLIEAQDRVLPSFSPASSAAALRHLQQLGVEVHTGARVTDIRDGALTIASASTRTIAAGSILWAAGVQASPLGRCLGVPLDRSGRVVVGPDLCPPGLPSIFVCGDLASFTPAGEASAVPGVAQAAIQMGRFAAEIIASQARGASAPRPAFRYRDPGILATIGRAKAVAQLPRAQFAGFPAWLLWAGIHILWLINFRSRLTVMLEWAWAYLVFERGARLITGDDRTGTPPHTP